MPKLDLSEKLDNFELTDAEKRTALLALEGKSNKAIAEQLGVAVGTTEHHLSMTYLKVGVKSRTELLAKVAFSSNDNFEHP